MSDITRMERIVAAIQEPLIDGTYRDAEVKKYAWMCDGCRLVWSMKHQARDCESRQHVSYFEQEYWTNGYDNYGKPNPPTLYPREAIRREPLPQTRASYSVRHKGYLFHVVTDPEAEAHRSLAAQTAHDDWVINQTGRAFRARIAGQPVWCYTAEGLPKSVYVTPTQAIALELPLP